MGEVCCRLREMLRCRPELPVNKRQFLILGTCTVTLLAVTEHMNICSGPTRAKRHVFTVCQRTSHMNNVASKKHDADAGNEIQHPRLGCATCEPSSVDVQPASVVRK